MNNQDDLDPKLQQLYRQLPKEQPSPELDAKILAAAKIITANQNQKKPRHWQAPFALAASVVLVSSITLYMHEENPTAFDASVPAAQAPHIAMPKRSMNNSSDSAPDAEMAKHSISGKSKTNHIAEAKLFADQKSTSQKAKDSPMTQSTDAPIANYDLTDHRLTALAENKVDIKNRADQMTETTLARKSEELLQSSVATKKPTARLAETEVANTGIDNLAASPSPIAAAPEPHMQVAEPRYLKADRLQDAHQTSGQLSAANAESDKPAEIKKLNAESELITTSMPAAPMSALAGTAMPMAKQLEKQHIVLDEKTARTEAMQNIGASVLSIEGVAMGMSREQVVAQGLTCYVDICHLDLNQPQQAMYWGMPTANARLTAFLRGHVVTKLLLEQKNAQLNQVKTALSNVGIESQQSCIGEKGSLLFSRQLAAGIFNVRSMDVGLSLAICQQTKALYKP